MNIERSQLALRFEVVSDDVGPVLAADHRGIFVTLDLTWQHVGMPGRRELDRHGTPVLLDEAVAMRLRNALVFLGRDRNWPDAPLFPFGPKP